MVDLHCHLLPGIDDGPAALDEAVMMCRIAAAEGCEAMFCTPHQHHPFWWNEDRAELERLRRELQERVGERPRLLPGAEIRVDSELLAEVSRLPQGGLQPLAGSRYLLLELDRRGLGPDPAPIIHELVVDGWRPVLAHPELYPWLMAELEQVERLVALGATLQITAMSVTGEFGRRAHEGCRRLLDAGLVHFVASDCHGVDARPPGLRRAFSRIAADWSDEMARALTTENPTAVLENRPLPRPVHV